MKGPLCGGCHVDLGDGKFDVFKFDMANLAYPNLGNFKADTVQDLAEYLVAEMPKNMGGKCVGDCANDIAAYLWTYVKLPSKSSAGFLKDFPFAQQPQSGTPNALGQAKALDGGALIFPGNTAEGADPFFSVQSKNAALSIQQKAYLGWLVDDEVRVSEHDGAQHTFTLYDQAAADRSEPKLLAVYLTGYEDDGAFVVSYLKTSNDDATGKPGILVHYVEYAAPDVSQLLDLKPDSTKQDLSQDFKDAAIQLGEAVDVSNLFNIQVLDEGMDDEGDHWAEISIVPLSEAALEK